MLCATSWDDVKLTLVDNALFEMIACTYRLGQFDRALVRNDSGYVRNDSGYVRNDGIRQK